MRNILRENELRDHLSMTETKKAPLSLELYCLNAFFFLLFVHEMNVQVFSVGILSTEKNRQTFHPLG